MFDHEKLDAHRLSIEFNAWAGVLVEEMPRGRRPNAAKHLDDASISIALNIAEGNGKRSFPDRVRFLEITKLMESLIKKLEQTSTSTSTSTSARV